MESAETECHGILWRWYFVPEDGRGGQVRRSARALPGLGFFQDPDGQLRDGDEKVLLPAHGLPVRSSRVRRDMEHDLPGIRTDQTIPLAPLRSRGTDGGLSRGTNVRSDA